MFMNEYPENPHYDLALSLWCYYRVICEQYDRGVCTGTNDRGVAIPMNQYEYSSINRHARKIRKEITQIATDYHVIPQDFDTAKQESSRLSEDVMETLMLEREKHIQRIVNQE